LFQPHEDTPVTLIFGLVAVLGLLLGLGFVFSRMKTETAAQSTRITLGVIGVLAGLFLTLRGAGVLGVPIAGAAIGMLGIAMRGGRSKAGGQERTGSRAPSHRGMDAGEAREILGVGKDAREDEIRSAHRTLMKRVHPDAGGSDGLASRVTLARDVLLDALKK
jgi:hypothetical protein